MRGNVRREKKRRQSALEYKKMRGSERKSKKRRGSV
jgi:hypothetical protein